MRFISVGRTVPQVYKKSQISVIQPAGRYTFNSFETHPSEFTQILQHSHKSREPFPHLCKERIIAPMIKLTIPGRGTFQIEHLVADVNGTLALDGKLLDGIAKKIALLRDKVQIHMLTANTHGKQAEIDQALNLRAIIIQKGNEAQQKADYIRQLGAEKVIALGQGANDAEMLKIAIIGIAVNSLEGLAVEALNAADLLLPDTLSALDLLNHPMRLVASLRK